MPEPVVDRTVLQQQFVPLATGGLLLLGLLVSLPSSEEPPAVAEPPQAELNPAVGGDDHLRQPIPEFISGDECLFCHRTVGTTWEGSPHQSTIRIAEPGSPALAVLEKHAGKEFAADVDYILGVGEHQRYLRSRQEYGQLAICSSVYLTVSQKLDQPERKPAWEEHQFARRCAGCHASGLDVKTESFIAVSLDCFVCHGDTPLEHARDSSQVLLAKKQATSPRVVISLCGQCHLRGGSSATTDRPYPHRFVAGDNLFRDFRFDWSAKHLESLHPYDRHIVENARDVVLSGMEQVSCLSCHTVHTSSTEKHQKLPRQPLCAVCHEPETDRLRSFPPRHNSLCEY